MDYSASVKFTSAELRTINKPEHYSRNQVKHLLKNNPLVKFPFRETQWVHFHLHLHSFKCNFVIHQHNMKHIPGKGCYDNHATLYLGNRITVETACIYSVIFFDGIPNLTGVLSLYILPFCLLSDTSRCTAWEYNIWNLHIVFFSNVEE